MVLNRLGDLARLVVRGDGDAHIQIARGDLSHGVRQDAQRPQEGAHDEEGGKRHAHRRRGDVDQDLVMQPVALVGIELGQDGGERTDRDHQQRHHELLPVAAEEQAEVLAVALEDEGAEGGEIVADHEVGVGEIEDRQHQVGDDVVGDGGRRLRGVGPPRRRQPERPDDEGHDADAGRGQERQLGQPALDRVEGMLALEVVLDRREQPAGDRPVEGQQQDHAGADRAPGVGPGAGQHREDDGDREIEGEDRRRHQEIAAAQGGDLGGGRAHADGPTR